MIKDGQANDAACNVARLQIHLGLETLILLATATLITTHVSNTRHANIRLHSFTFVYIRLHSFTFVDIRLHPVVSGQDYELLQRVEHVTLDYDGINSIDGTREP